MSVLFWSVAWVLSMALAFIVGWLVCAQRDIWRRQGKLKFRGGKSLDVGVYVFPPHGGRRPRS